MKQRRIMSEEEVNWVITKIRQGYKTEWVSNALFVSPKTLKRSISYYSGLDNFKELFEALGKIPLKYERTKMELTRENLEKILGNIAYSYLDGYRPEGFPIEFGTKEYFQALESVIYDVWQRIDRKFGEYTPLESMDCVSREPMDVLWEDVNG